MYTKIIIKGMFGQHYTLQSQLPPRIKGNLKANDFSERHAARRFVMGLQVPHGYWQRLLQEAGHHDGGMLDEAEAINTACDWMVRGRLRAYPVNPPHHAATTRKKRTLQANGKVYDFAPATEQFFNNTEAKHFNNAVEADAFLQALNPGDEKLRGIATELNLPAPVTANANPAELRQAIAASLAAGTTVVLIGMIASATPPAEFEEVVESNAVGNRQSNLGPHVTDPEQIKRKDIHIVLDDEFEHMLGTHDSLLNDLAFTLTTDMGEEHEGTIDNGRISISQAQINSGFKLKITDLPGYLEV